MKTSIFLDTRKSSERKNGYPLTCSITHKGKRIRFSMDLFYRLSDWDTKTDLPKDKYHALHVRKKRLELETLELDFLSGKIKLEEIKPILLGDVGANTESFYEFAEMLIKEQRDKNKQSNARVYQNAINQLQVFRERLSFGDIDYSLLNRFKDWQLRKGNSKNTISNYLRTYRSIYNEAVRRKLTDDLLPFKDVFSNITVKANRTKKKYITKDQIKVLESLSGLTVSQQRAVDLWLLLFYFGGQDLKDVYYLKREQIANDRVYFVRGKLDGNGYEFDLKISERAKKIITKYSTKGKYIFPWRKDFDGYRTFRDNFRRDLLRVVKNYNASADENTLKLNVLPKGGNITIKVARHSFATIGKQLFIETDLLRELMGHERNDVDTIYKDKYPEAVRDEAHEKIIG